MARHSAHNALGIFPVPRAFWSHWGRGSEGEGGVQHHIPLPLPLPQVILIHHLLPLLLLKTPMFLSNPPPP